MLRPVIVGLALGFMSACQCALPPRPTTPVVGPLKTLACPALPTPLRTVKVDPAGDDTASGLCATSASCTPWKTLAHAATSAQPGDLVLLAGGTWSESFEPAVDGTVDHPIVFAAAPNEVAMLTSRLELHGRAFLIFSGLQFDSPLSDSWVVLDGAAHDLAFIGNAFDSHAKNRADGAFKGLSLSGTKLTLCGNAFGSWLGDEVFADAVDKLLVVNNDWSQASGQHSLLTIIGHHVVIRGNAFRNPWQRSLHITDRDDQAQTDDVVVEDNTFIDSDWVPGAPHPSATAYDQGGNEVVRFLGARGVFRNNLLVGNHEGNDWPCHAIMNFQTFQSAAGYDVRRYTQFRVYGNTFDSNQTTSLAFYVGPSGALDDNQFKNNIITRAAKFAISACSDGVPWSTYRLEGNLLPGESLQFPEVSQRGVTVEAMQRSAPTVFTNNDSAMPTYADESFGGRVAADFTSYSLAKLPEAFAAYRLAPGSAGHGKAVPLTRVAVAVTDDVTLHVDDALWFSDGQGVTQGDLLRIGATRARVIARDVVAKTLTLDAPVTAAVGDPVQLDSADGDVGVHVP